MNSELRMKNLGLILAAGGMCTMIHSAASEAATKPDVAADECRWTPIESRSEDCQSSGRTEPDSCVAGAAFTGGCPEPGDLMTKAAERNNVAKTTILHACSTGRTFW